MLLNASDLHSLRAPTYQPSNTHTYTQIQLDNKIYWGAHFSTKHKHSKLIWFMVVNPWILIPPAPASPFHIILALLTFSFFFFVKTNERGHHINDIWGSINPMKCRIAAATAAAENSKTKITKQKQNKIEQKFESNKHRRRDFRCVGSIHVSIKSYCLTPFWFWSRCWWLPNLFELEFRK